MIRHGLQKKKQVKKAIIYGTHSINIRPNYHRLESMIDIFALAKDVLFRMANIQ